MFRVDSLFDADNKLSKFRDYQHRGNFGAHIRAHSTIRTLFSVYCNVDPITERPLSPSELYYVVQVTMHEEHGLGVYWYLVPSEANGNKPTGNSIERALNGYNDNRVEGGRDALDYIDADKTSEEGVDRLAEKYTERLING